MAYVAPNEDTVVVVGGRGTMADAAALNGGGATKAVWDTEADPTKFIAANGGPIAADTAITYDHTGNGNGERNFAKAGIGTGVTVGTLAYCSGTNITAGIYEVTSVDGAGAWICCNDIVATDDNADSVVNVGGALNYLQGALDNDVNNAASYNRYIYINGQVNDNDGSILALDTAGGNASIDINTYSGTGTTKVYIIGYNATLAAEAEITLTTGAALANGLLDFNADIDYTEWRNFDFNGGGNGKATYCIKNAVDTANNHILKSCRIHNASSHGMFFGATGNGWILIDVEVYSNGASGAGGGIIGRSTARGALTTVGVSVHDNPGTGIMAGSHSNLTNILIYDNTGNGLDLESTADFSRIFNVTSYSNGGAGMRIDAVALGVYIVNVTCVGNTGVGFDFDGTITTSYFGYNHSYGNSAHYSEGADGTFADLKEGDNATAEEVFTDKDANPPDFTPTGGAKDTGVGRDGTGDN